MQSLHHFIVDSYDLEELRTLCFNLHINYDALPGDGTVAKARELILYLTRRKKLERLLDALPTPPGECWDPAALYAALPTFEARDLQAEALKSVQVFISGDLSSLTADRRSAVIDALAGLLKISPQDIRVYSVYEGSVVFDLGLPLEAVQRIRLLLQSSDAQLRLLRVEKVILELEPDETETWVLRDRKYLAVEPLITALEDKGSGARQSAAEALGQIGDARAVEPLIAVPGDEDRWVRARAAEASERIGDARAVEPLTDEMILLKQIPLFSDLLREQLQPLAGVLEHRSYRKGQMILHQREEGNSLYVIVAGRVRIYTLSPDGHELSVSICDPGDFFGEMSLLSGDPRSANAEAMQRTEVLMLHRQAFRNQLLSNPAAAIRIIETLSQRLRHITESAEELVSTNVPQRIARKLLELTERYGVTDEEGVLIDLDLSQEAIASLAGTTRESANRALSSMREQDILQIERLRIRVLQPEKLEELLY